jgi:hypothetical protein
VDQLNLVTYHVIYFYFCFKKKWRWLKPPPVGLVGVFGHPFGSMGVARAKGVAEPQPPPRGQEGGRNLLKVYWNESYIGCEITSKKKKIDFKFIKP